MHFLKAILAGLPVLSLASGAVLQQRSLTAAQMVKNINVITQLSEKLQPVVSAIQTGDNVVYKRQSNPFQPVIDGFNEIIKTAHTDISQMGGTQPYGEADAKKVCDAFATFVVIHQELLRIVIGKSGILESLFLGPVASVLRSLESVVDSLAFGVIDSVPYCAASATQNKDKLDTTLGKAVCAYTPGGTLGLDVFC